jgi:hypothetical protein
MSNVQIDSSKAALSKIEKQGRDDPAFHTFDFQFKSSCLDRFSFFTLPSLLGEQENHEKPTPAVDKFLLPCDSPVKSPVLPISLS